MRSRSARSVGAVTALLCAMHALCSVQELPLRSRQLSLTLPLPWAEFMDGHDPTRVGPMMHMSDASTFHDLTRVKEPTHAAHSSLQAVSSHGPHIAISISHRNRERPDEAVMLYSRAKSPDYALQATWHSRLPHVAPIPAPLQQEEFASHPHLRAGFGRALALDDAFLAVGSPRTRNTGAVDLYSLFQDRRSLDNDPFFEDPFHRLSVAEDIESLFRPMHQTALFCPYRSRITESDDPMFGDALAFHGGLLAVSAPGFRWDAQSDKGVVFYYKKEYQMNSPNWVLSGHIRKDPLVSISQTLQEFRDLVANLQPPSLQHQLENQLSSPIQSSPLQESIDCKLENHVIVCVSHVGAGDVGKDIPAQIVQGQVDIESLPSQHPVQLMSTRGVVIAVVCLTGMFLALCMSSRRFFRPKSKVAISPFTPTGDFGSMVEFQDVVSVGTFSPVVTLPALKGHSTSQSAKKAVKDANKYASSPEDA